VGEPLPFGERLNRTEQVQIAGNGGLEGAGKQPARYAETSLMNCEHRGRFDRDIFLA
jgi:hypothetical protein